MLSEAFHKNFFSRYTRTSVMEDEPFTLEICLFLHPSYKDPEVALSKIVRLVNSQQPNTTLTEVNRKVREVRDVVLERLRGVMRMITAEATPENATQTAQDILEEWAQPPPPEFSAELYEMFPVEHQAPPVEEEQRVRDRRVNDEILRWQNDRGVMQRDEKGTESILEFWRRQEEQGIYPTLSKVARIIFAVPCSSAEIERDFEVAGMVTTTQRTSISSPNLDMTTFLNRNRRFVDIAQCARISDGDLKQMIPTNMVISMEANQDFDLEEAWADAFAEESDEEDDYDGGWV